MPFLFALTFLTRLPLPLKIDYDQKIAARSMAYYPLVGLVIGLILVFLDYLLSLILPLNVVNIMILLVLVFLSGGLHLDGFMDTVDGLFSGRDREKMMEIMHDSRVGSFGVIAFFLLFLLKFNLLTVTVTPVRIPALILMPVVSRWLITISAYNYPVTTSSKLGKSFITYLTGKHICLSSLWIIIVMGSLSYCFRFPYYYSLIIVIVPLLFMIIFAGWVNKRLNGLTGDVYGALNEITEVLVLLIILVLVTI